MKILFGIPDITHRELADLEINGIKALIPECDTIHYGPVSSKRGLINKIINTIKNAIEIRRALTEKKYDLLFLNTTFDFNAVVRDSITYFIIKPTGIKIFLKFHGSDPDLLDKVSWFKQKLAHRLLENVKYIGVLSSQERNALIERGSRAEEIFIVKNPVNPDLYKKDENYKIKWGLDNDTFTFIFCARFLPFKGIMDVLEAISTVRNEFLNIHLFCIGDGPEMTKAKLFIEKKGLNSFVTFTGFIPEIETRSYYANADALVFPSSHEGFPMVVFQSLASGIPIITTRIAASADYLVEPDNVLWVEFNNPVQIAKCMINLLTDRELFNRMSQNNKKKSLQFTTDKNAVEYFNIFEQIIKN